MKKSAFLIVIFFFSLSANSQEIAGKWSGLLLVQKTKLIINQQLVIFLQLTKLHSLDKT